MDHSIPIDETTIHGCVEGLPVPRTCITVALARDQPLYSFVGLGINRVGYISVVNITCESEF